MSFIIAMFHGLRNVPNAALPPSVHLDRVAWDVGTYENAPGPHGPAWGCTGPHGVAWGGTGPHAVAWEYNQIHACQKAPCTATSTSLGNLKWPAQLHAASCG
eukprot:365241-Chlamydomonas_euryale.AAC.5